MTNTATATWVHEFPAGDYDISPIILNAEDLKDTSWHNDVCPSFGSSVRCGRDADSVEFSIWCEVDDPAQREASEHKYTVTCNPWGAPEQDVLIAAGIPISPDGQNVWSGDDPAEALKAYRRLVATATAALIAAGMVPEQD